MGSPSHLDVHDHLAVGDQPDHHRHRPAHLGRYWLGMGEIWARYGRGMGEVWGDMGRYATTMGRRTAARLARLAPPPPPTLSAPRPTAMPTMAAHARFFTC